MSVFNALPLSFNFLVTHVHKILLKEKVNFSIVAVDFVGLRVPTNALVISIIVCSSLRFENGSFLSQQSNFLRFSLTGLIVTSHNNHYLSPLQLCLQTGFNALKQQLFWELNYVHWRPFIHSAGHVND